MNFLDDGALIDLTGYQQPSRQARVLEQHGIRFVRRPDGKIRVTWEQVNAQRAGGAEQERQRPNLEAARG